MQRKEMAVLSHISGGGSPAVFRIVGMRHLHGRMQRHTTLVRCTCSASPFSLGDPSHTACARVLTFSWCLGFFLQRTIPCLHPHVRLTGLRVVHR